MIDFFKKGYKEDPQLMHEIYAITGKGLPDLIITIKDIVRREVNQQQGFGFELI